MNKKIITIYALKIAYVDLWGGVEVEHQYKGVVRLTDHLNMIIAVEWDIKPQTNQTSKKI